ncbi:MAG TPA: DUF4476 domain-containing protein [Puia sp.]|nr:DUF4476 domain-containing protein [Puia sp.]
MGRIGLAIIFFLSIVRGYAQQQGYLVLIDADNNQSFQARIGDTIYISSEVGHLSIPRLKDSIYNIGIRVPGSQNPELIFSVNMNKKDQGFQLRNPGKRDCALYNWQTHELKMALPDSGSNQLIPQNGVKKEDAFSRLMAAVVNDTSVMYNSFVARKPLIDSARQDSIAAAIVDSAIGNGNNNINSIQTSTVATAKVAVKDEKNKPVYPSIKKISQKTLKKTMRIVYVDTRQQNMVDTITLFIPLEKQKAADSANSNQKKAGKEVRNFSDSSGEKSNPAATKTKTAISFSDCKALASDYDMDVIRVNILVENTEENKIKAARKFLSTKCISVNQARTLSELFASDKSKYQFFEAAYPFISDRSNFGQLVSALSDANYINQFKAIDQ